MLVYFFMPPSRTVIPCAAKKQQHQKLLSNIFYNDKNITMVKWDRILLAKTLTSQSYLLPLRPHSHGNAVIPFYIVPFQK